MTALSPVEQAEVTRFGLYDTFIITDMENRSADEAQCEAEGCTAGITTLTMIRCCKAGWRTCDQHFVQEREKAVRFLTMCVARMAHPHCGKCRHDFKFGAVFDDLYKVIPV